MESTSVLLGLEKEENTSDPARLSSTSYKHPIALAFHLLFRTLAIFIYLFCGWFSSSFVSNFVVLMIVLSLDFWTVKNVTGRLLAGLRWWNYVNAEGKSHWVFESRKDPSAVNSTEAYIFWLGLIGYFFIWVIFFFVALLGAKFSWAMVVCIALLLNGANLYGYIRCKIQTRENLSSMATRVLTANSLKWLFQASKPSNPVQVPTTSKFTETV